MVTTNSHEDNQIRLSKKKKWHITKCSAIITNVKEKPQYLNISYSWGTKLEGDYSYNGIICFLEGGFLELSLSVMRIIHLK